MIRSLSFLKGECNDLNTEFVWEQKSINAISYWFEHKVVQKGLDEILSDFMKNHSIGGHIWSEDVILFLETVDKFLGESFGRLHCVLSGNEGQTYISDMEEKTLSFLFFALEDCGLLALLRDYLRVIVQLKWLTCLINESKSNSSSRHCSAQERQNLHSQWDEFIVPQIIMQYDFEMDTFPDHLIPAVESETGLFLEALKTMKRFGLLDRMGKDIWELSLDLIKDRMQCFKGAFDQSYLDISMIWVSRGTLDILEILLEDPNKYLQDLTSVYKRIFIELRISEFFDMLVQYPDSKPALLDLTVIGEDLCYKNGLVKQLTETFGKRLLHVGANTGDILTIYVNCIRAVRLIDPSGYILDQVIEPVRRYLKGRDDSIRSIMQMLADDCELYEEMRNGSLIELDNVNNLDANYLEKDWLPTPTIQGVVDKISQKRHGDVDIITLLVNIADSTDIFVREYQNILAERLLDSITFEIEKEIQQLELLKIRFGDASLQMCEVMVKDMSDSKRLLSSTDPLQTSILSKLFWPSVKLISSSSSDSNNDDSGFQVPSCVKLWQDSLEKRFTALKPSRHLVWQNHMGLVDLTLNFEGGRAPMKLSVSPPIASLIMAFQEEMKDNVIKQYTLHELSQATGIKCNTELKRKLNFLIRKRIIKETSAGVYAVLESEDSVDFDSESEADDLGDLSMGECSEQGQEITSKMHVYASFITGMLTNLGALPIERIQMMLGMFVQGPEPYNESIEDLQEYLNELVETKKIEYQNEKYSAI